MSSLANVTCTNSEAGDVAEWIPVPIPTCGKIYLSMIYTKYLHKFAVLNFSIKVYMVMLLYILICCTCVVSLYG